MNIEDNREDIKRDHKSFHQPTTLLFTEDEVKQVDWDKVWEEWK